MNYATYCPEDDRIRLYVGRVPRDEYEKLRAEGWTSTPKQDCDFVATWTPSREATALSYCDSGEIEDEDQSPEDRAADRAERFSGYRDKRLDEACGHADRYESVPSAHGYQSQAKADRMAARHDRIGGKAVSQWDKAEYWQQRTAGVISHALYVSSPAVRMGRIKTIEADLRKELKWLEEYRAKHARWTATAAEQDAEKAHKMAYHMANCYDHSYDYQHPRPESMPSHMRERGTSLYSLLTLEVDPITGHEAAAMWLAVHSEPKESTQYSRHLELRLAYERQMLEAQGGRAGMLEMEVGGWIGSHQIRKVNKSNASGRVVSVGVMAPTSANFDPKGKAYGPDYPRPMVLRMVKVERLATGAYRAPTEEDKQALKAVIEAEKAEAPEKEVCPLINPTDEDAQKLQDLWNAKLGDSPSEVLRLTQAQYSANSKGTYARAGTEVICETGHPHATKWGQKITRKDVFKVRLASSGNFAGAKRVVIITDKPQKPLPWKALEAAKASCPSAEKLRPLIPQIKEELRKSWSERQESQLFCDAEYVGWLRIQSVSQVSLTEAGIAAFAEFEKSQGVLA